MTKDIWLNLPVKNLERSKAFFTAIGFVFNTTRDTEFMTCMLVGEKKAVIMLFAEPVFASFTQHPMTDTTQSSEILISFDASSREEIDTLCANVLAAGGNLFGPASEIQGWMYGCAFADLDGHRWNALFMDKDKMTK